METHDAPAGRFQRPGSVTPEPPGTARQRPGSGNLSLIAGICFIALVGLLLAAGVISGRAGLAPSAGRHFTIPAGARASVARPGFDSAIPIPTDIRFTSPEDAVVSVRNLDDVEHRAGPFLVGAGQTFVQRFPKPGRYPLVCTVDPLETVVVTVEA